MKASYLNQYPEGYLCDEFTEPVTFELVNLKDDPDVRGKKLLPRTKNIPFISRTVSKDKETGKRKIVTIGYVTGESADGEAEIGRDIEWGLINAGRITLKPDRAKDQLKFEYINYCSFNT